jgi:hypothetical protein
MRRVERTTTELKLTFERRTARMLGMLAVAAGAALLVRDRSIGAVLIVAGVFTLLVHANTVITVCDRLTGRLRVHEQNPFVFWHRTQEFTLGQISGIEITDYSQIDDEKSGYAIALIDRAGGMVFLADAESPDDPQDVALVRDMTRFLCGAADE